MYEPIFMAYLSLYCITIWQNYVALKLTIACICFC